VVHDDFNSKLLNVFPGWKYGIDKNYDENKIKLILHHILVMLCNGSTSTYELFLDFYAHLIQKPTEKVTFALLLTSPQGIGKDTLYEFMEQMIGSHLCACSNKLEEFLGKFNSLLENKLLVCFNEIETGQVHKTYNRIKSIITNTKTNIRRLYKDVYVSRDYAHITFHSNENTSIKMPLLQRRIVAIDCCQTPGAKDYYVKLREEMKTAGPDFFSFLALRNISKFNPNPSSETIHHTRGNERLMLQESNAVPFLTLAKVVFKLFDSSHFCQNISKIVCNQNSNGKAQRISVSRRSDLYVFDDHTTFQFFSDSHEIEEFDILKSNYTYYVALDDLKKEVDLELEGLGYAKQNKKTIRQNLKDVQIEAKKTYISPRDDDGLRNSLRLYCITPLGIYKSLLKYIYRNKDKSFADIFNEISEL
jgi:hypothetical protein